MLIASGRPLDCLDAIGGMAAFGLPSGWRISHEEPAGHCHQQIRDTKVSEGVEHAHMLDKPRCHWRHDRRSGTEAAYRNADDKPSAIRKPFEQNIDGNDMAEAHADAANHAVTEIQPPESVIREARQEDSNP